MAQILTQDELACGGVLTVDLAALRRNYRILREAAPASDVAGVVKADAYGLGAVEVTRALFAEGCRHFFVAHLAEALALRAIVPADAKLIVLHGPMPGAEAEFAARGIVPVLNSPGQIAAWSALAASLGRTLPASLQLDTGMSRLGLSEAELESLLATPGAFDGIGLCGVMSHFACSDTPEHPANAAQIALFGRLRGKFPGLPTSLAASSGIFLGSVAQFDLLRPGAALYGVNPVPGRPNPMRAVVRLDAMVAQIREAPAGTPVGYGHTEATTTPARLATLGVGYADGYRRALAGRASAWFGGHKMKLIGRISMDLMVVDATGLDIAPGMLVELIGPHCDVDALAEQAGTIGYEILTSLGRRFARRYVG
jgi:alanine racemase